MRFHCLVRFQINLSITALSWKCRMLILRIAHAYRTSCNITFLTSLLACLGVGECQFTDKLWLTGRALGQVFNFRSGCMDTMHLLPSVAIQHNLELKTRPKQLLGSLPLVIALPGQSELCKAMFPLAKFSVIMPAIF